MTPPEVFKVSWPGRILDQMRARAQQDQAKGQLSSFTTAMEMIQTKLSTIPLQCGDPCFHYRYLKLEVYMMIQPPFVVRYAVDEQNKIVYVVNVESLDKS